MMLLYLHVTKNLDGQRWRTRTGLGEVTGFAMGLGQLIGAEDAYKRGASGREAAAPNVTSGCKPLKQKGPKCSSQDDDFDNLLT